MKSWYAIRAAGSAGNPENGAAAAVGAEVMIYDEIGAFGISAKAFLAELGALPDATPLSLRINSPGGSVFDAVAIYNALKRHAGAVTVWIDGIAASAASYVAMAGDEVVMPANAFLMVHDPSGMVLGTAEDMRAMAGALDKIKTSLVAGYVAKSGASDEDIAALMAKETWLDAEAAVGLGFADRLAEPVRLAAHFDLTRFRNPPPTVAEAMADLATGQADNAVDQADDADETGLTEEAEDQTDPATPVENAAAPDAAATRDPRVIRAEAFAQARAVVDLCRLAGLPQMADRFLTTETSLDEVRAALLEAKAEAGPVIDPHHPQPGRSSDARPWGEVIARTFRLTPGRLTSGSPKG